MRAVRYHEYGGSAVLRVDDVERPAPGHGEVLVSLRAASVNPVDFLYREGVLGHDEGGAFSGTALPSTTGTDLAGVVEAVGDGVTDLAAGDRVFGTGMADAPNATFADVATVPADHLAVLPDGVEFEAAAAAAHVGGTAWRAMIEFGRVSPADTVLVHGASGGVGHIAVQLAACAGARVVGTAGSQRAREAVRSLGADRVLDYDAADLDERIREAAGGSVDLILDPHTDEYLDLDIAVAANGGTITHLAGDFPHIRHPNATRTRELTIQGIAMHNTPDIPAVLTRLGRLLADGAVTPLVDRRYTLEEATAAHRTLETEHVVGKVIVTP